MTSLEFINKVIKTQEESINENKRVLGNWLKSDKFTAKEKNNVINNLKENIKYGETKLQTFQQIKEELEAWEVAKDKKVDIYQIINSYDFNQLKITQINYAKCYQLNEQEYNTIKKALEVGDE